jgi:hypothetical protein
LLGAAAEPVEDRRAFVDEVGDDGSGVVEFVWAADQQHFVWGFLQVLNVGSFAFKPRGFAASMVWGAVGAALDQVVNMMAKLGFNELGVLDAPVFDGIVEQGGDGLVFWGAKLQAMEATAMGWEM